MRAEERRERPQTPRVRHLRPVYSQHWLLFTESQTLFKWLLEFTTPAGRNRPLCDPNAPIATVQEHIYLAFLRVFAGGLRFNPAEANERKDDVIEKVCGSPASKHFCHQHCGIHIKRGTFGYLFTSFGCKVRVFPSPGRA